MSDKSDTPRTDEVAEGSYYIYPLARQLERELASAEAVIDSAFDLIAKGADESAFAILRAYRGKKK